MIALSHHESHAYALADQVAALSYMRFCPSRARVLNALIALERRGLVMAVWRDFPTRSDHLRRVFALTAVGRQRMESERRAINELLLVLSRAIIRQARLHEGTITVRR